MTTYSFSLNAALSDTLMKAVRFHCRLCCGHPLTWAEFKAPEISMINQEWLRLWDADKAVDAEMIDPLSLPVELVRNLGRIMEVYILSHDGRYNCLQGYLTRVAFSHPNPSSLSNAFNAAASKREKNRYRGPINDLSPDDELLFRHMASRLLEASSSPGQAFSADLSDIGLKKLRLADLSPSP